MNQILKRINDLDPKKDALEIVRLSGFYDFPWDYNRALELALYKTFAIPSISKILYQSGEFEIHPQKRYDDTDLILGEILEYGYDSPRGKMIIERLNGIHSHYPISNNDYLYTLSTFIYEPVRWINKYGYRKLSDNEKIAGYHVFVEIGKRMNIKEIPESYKDFEAFNIAYEQEHFLYNTTNYRVAKSTEDLMLGWLLPKWSFDLTRPFLHSIMEDTLVYSCGFQPSPKWMKYLVIKGIKIRNKIVNLIPIPKKLQFRSTLSNKSYENGYIINNLGPEKLNKTSAKGCPFHSKPASTTAQLPFLILFIDLL